MRLRILELSVLFSVLIAGLIFPPVTTCGQQSDTQTEYNEAIERWRAAIKKAKRSGTLFHVGSQQESIELREEWRQAVAEGNEELAKVKTLALKLFREQETPDNELLLLTMRLAEDLFNQGRYLEAYEVCNRILKFKPQSEAMIFLRGRCSYILCEFDVAKEFATNYTSMFNALPDEERVQFELLDEMKAAYDKELEIRAAEAEADDLPRVEIQTTKGTIVIELFENEAPETVGNFISLVEQGYYKEKLFHRVINQFVAQTGGFNSEGVFDSTGYYIYDECLKPGARRHFRGVVSMAKATEPNTGSSQFFFTYVNKPALDGRHTVFGRVISGWKALDRLNRTFQVDKEGKEVPIMGVRPDKIVSAKVIRKRDHEYKPNKVKTQ